MPFLYKIKKGFTMANKIKTYLFKKSYVVLENYAQKKGFIVVDKEKYREKIFNVISQYLYEKTYKILENYCRSEGFYYRYVDNSGEIVVKVTELLFEKDGVEKFIKCYPTTTEDTIKDNAKKYVDRFYDDDFIVENIKRYIDEDSVREEMAHDLLLNIKFTYPYNLNFYNRNNISYWKIAIHSVQNLRELGSYLNGDVAIFVERYAPDWEKVISEG